MSAQQRVVIVTGAGSGIGFATATRFAAAGDLVVGVDIRGDGPEGIDFRIADVTDPAPVTALIDGVAEQHGRLDVLANVAGIVQFGRVEQVTVEEWQRVLAVDLTGPFLTSQAAIPHLRATKGNIVNVASVAGLRGQAYSAAYCAAKGRLVLLTKALALELARDQVRVNCVCPAGVDTPLLHGVAESMPSDVDGRLVGRLQMSLPGFIDPDEVAASIAYLASPDAVHITGLALALDGGVSA